MTTILLLSRIISLDKFHIGMSMSVGQFAFCVLLLLLGQNDFMTWQSHLGLSRHGPAALCSGAGCVGATDDSTKLLTTTQSPQNTRPLKISAIKPEM